MKRITVLGIMAILAIALTFDSVMAQQGGMQRRGGGGVNARQVLGLLAFDAEANLTDDQLIKVRSALKPIHQKQQDLLRSVRSGERDFQDVREDMLGLRNELLEAVSSVLTADQVERLKDQMQRQANRGGQGGRGRRGGGGGGGGR